MAAILGQAQGPVLLFVKNGEHRVVPAPKCFQQAVAEWVQLPAAQWQAADIFLASNSASSIWKHLEPAVSSQPLDHVPLDAIDIHHSCKPAGVGVVHLSR